LLQFLVNSKQSSKQLSPIENLVSSQPLPDGVLEALALAIRIMSRLRALDGCPWDRAQTRQSLTKNLIEETYEVIDAIEKGNIEGLKEELGDLLLQVIFQAEIAQEKGEFDLADVAEALAEKLIRRHPHVFGDVQANNAEEALQSWNNAKRSEGEHVNNLSSVPEHMPALLRARKVVDKAGRVGFEWPSVKEAFDKLDEEIGELRRAVVDGDQKHIREELGDVLFMTACVARYLHECPELALQATIEKFLQRFKYIEKRLAEEGLTPEQATLEKMDGYWDEAKGMEL